MEETVAAKFFIVTGYQGAPDVDVAIERGEMHCRTVTVTAYFGREPFLTWGKNRFVRPLVQTGRKPSPSLPEVPTIHELMNRYKTTPKWGAGWQRSSWRRASLGGQWWLLPVSLRSG